MSPIWAVMGPIDTAGGGHEHTNNFIGIHRIWEVILGPHPSMVSVVPSGVSHSTLLSP